MPAAVRIMAGYQLEGTVSQAEVEAIVAFLGALTGTQPEGFQRVRYFRPPGSGAVGRLGDAQMMTGYSIGDRAGGSAA